MKKRVVFAVVAFAMFGAVFAGSLIPSAFAAEEKKHYKAGKDIDFEALIIQGQLKRPELSVVTGDAAQGTDGLLRMRENFIDQMALDQGEDVQ